MSDIDQILDTVGHILAKSNTEISHLLKNGMGWIAHASCNLENKKSLYQLVGVRRFCLRAKYRVAIHRTDKYGVGQRFTYAIQAEITKSTDDKLKFTANGAPVLSGV